MTRAWIAALAVFAAAQSQGAEPADVWSHIDASRVCPVAALWRIGVGTERPPVESLESVVWTSVDGRDAWRSTHTPLKRPEQVRSSAVPGFDFFDLDQRTLAPLQSEHRGQRGDGSVVVTRFDYRKSASSVQRLNADGTVAETIPLEASHKIIADGPGGAVMDQAIAWTDGLHLRGYRLDRWRGREKERVRQVDFTVTGRGSVEIRGRRYETFVVSEDPADASYRVISQITVEPPHRSVHVRYFPAGAKDPARVFVSEVVTLMHEPACPQVSSPRS
jgi:hypothetical protein